MPFASLLAIVGTISLVPLAAAHGVVTGIVADGTYYKGYQPYFKYQNPPPTVVGWSIPQDDQTGFVSPSAFKNPDIICHLGATPGGAYATVQAGKSVELQWTKWPESHHGPVIDYLANCNGECTTVDKTTLKFNKIDEQGLLAATPLPGKWASDKLIAANNSWTVTIPSTVAPGNYVLRHEIIALHAADRADGAQLYPQCINLKITGSGTDSLPSGVVGTALYGANDAGIFVNIYQTLASYIIPGPGLQAGGSTSPVPPSSTPSASSGISTLTTAVVASSVSPQATVTTVKTSTTPGPITPVTSTAAPEATSENNDDSCEADLPPVSQNPMATPPSATTFKTEIRSSETISSAADAGATPAGY